MIIVNECLCHTSTVIHSQYCAKTCLAAGKQVKFGDSRGIQTEKIHLSENPVRPMQAWRGGYQNGGSDDLLQEI